MRFTRKLKKQLSVKIVSDLTKQLALSDQTLASVCLSAAIFSA